MDRRTFNKLAGMAAVGSMTDAGEAVASSSAFASGTQAPGSDVLVLENAEWKVTFDRATGAMIGLKNKALSWTLARRPELGASFRLLVPLPEQRDNFVLGAKQKTVEARQVNATTVRLRWDDVLSEHGGVLPIRLTAEITLTERGLVFGATLDNRSPYTVETIDFPYIGDLNPLSREDTLAFRTMWYGNLSSDELYPHFGNGKGYWGVDVPTRTYGSHHSLFGLIQGNKNGLYVEMTDPTQPYYLEYTFEQHPGVLYGSVVPPEDTISGFPVHLEFRTCHFVFARAHTAQTLAPVTLRGYTGDWHAGVDVYKDWRATWFKPSKLPAWCRDVHSWAMLRMNTPEEDYTISYAKFAEYGREYAAHGVKAVQLVGWNAGGQDRDDPSQNTEPRLGMWAQFHQSIAETQALGVQVILFGKLNWADRTSWLYKNELYRYQATDPYGIPYEHGGYSYVTPTQLAGINNRRRAVMDFRDPGYREVAVREFKKILALGAGGWLWDEICHHGPVLYSFASGHGYVPPGYIYNGDLPLLVELRAAADRVNTEFVFSGEGPQDWLMQYVPVSETGIAATPICQYIDPNFRMLAGVSGFDDREKLNQILLYRYVIQYEPFLYKGHLTDFPLTLAYGKKVDALRQKYQAYLWDGEFRDMLGAEVTANGSHRFSVFRTAAGKHAVVVVNQETTRAVEAKVRVDGVAGLMVATPEDPDATPMGATVKIPARSAAVILEM